jgi:predicted permease
MTLALLERIAGIMVPMLAMAAVGWLYARRPAPDTSAINRINMDLFTPAPLSADQRGLMYIFASLPPAVLNFMVAERWNREPGKVAAIVLVGNTASVVFVPIGLALVLR